MVNDHCDINMKIKAPLRLHSTLNGNGIETPWRLESGMERKGLWNWTGLACVLALLCISRAAMANHLASELKYPHL